MARQRGIKLRHSTPYTPKQNSIAEFANQNRAETALTILQASTLPKTFWAKAHNMAKIVFSYIVRKKNTKTSFEILFGRQ